MKNILCTNEIYRLSKNEVLMMSLVGGTVESIKEEGWFLFKGEQAPMKKTQKLTEREAIELIIKAYHKVCDLKDFDYEINYIHDINTHNEISHMQDTIKKHLL